MAIYIEPKITKDLIGQHSLINGLLNGERQLSGQVLHRSFNQIINHVHGWGAGFGAGASRSKVFLAP